MQDDKEQMRRELAERTKKFQASGGKIQQVPAGETAVTIAKATARHRGGKKVIDRAVNKP